jgi:hypothetical protein
MTYPDNIPAEEEAGAKVVEQVANYSWMGEVVATPV